MAEERSMMEMLFGRSWETGAAACAAVVFILGGTALGLIYDNEKVVLMAITLGTSLGLALIGFLARSQKQHERDKCEPPAP